MSLAPHQFAAARLSVLATVNGWNAHLEEHPDGSCTVRAENQLTARPDVITVTYTPVRPGRTCPPRGVATRTSAHGVPHPEPVRFVDALDALMDFAALPREHTGCVCCGGHAPAGADLVLAPSGLCWACATWHLENATCVPSGECLHRPPGAPVLPHEVNVPTDPEFTWRYDPLANIFAADPEELVDWFDERGMLLLMTVVDGGHIALCEGRATEAGTFSGVLVSLENGSWTAVYEHPDGTFDQTGLHWLARHELFNVLCALHDGCPVPADCVLPLDA